MCVRSVSVGRSVCHRVSFLLATGNLRSVCGQRTHSLGCLTVHRRNNTRRLLTTISRSTTKTVYLCKIVQARARSFKSLHTELARPGYNGNFGGERARKTLELLLCVVTIRAERRYNITLKSHPAGSTTTAQLSTTVHAVCACSNIVKLQKDESD